MPRSRLLVVAGTLLVCAGLVVPAALGIHLHALGLLEAAAGTSLLVMSSALALNGSRPTRLANRHAVPAVLAMTAANSITPAGIGGALLIVRLHRRSGLSREQAVAAAGLRSVMGALTAAGATLLAAGTLGRSIPGTARLMHWAPVALAVVLVVALAFRPVRKEMRAFAVAVADLVRRPRSFFLLAVGCVGVTVAQLLTLHGAVTAVGGHLSWVQLLAALMGSAAAKSAMPSPGGVGPVEAALVGGLTTLGLGMGTAAAAVAVYRAAGHWLPALGGLASTRSLRRAQLV